MTADYLENQILKRNSSLAAPRSLELGITLANNITGGESSGFEHSHYCGLITFDLDELTHRRFVEHDLKVTPVGGGP